MSFAYRQHLHRRGLLKFHEGARSRRRSSLREGNEEQVYKQMLSSAVLYLETKQDETVSLPSDSPERLIIEALMGLIRQHEDSENVRESAAILSEKLRSMFSDSPSSSELGDYVKKLREGLATLHNSVEPSADPGPGQPEGDGGQGEPGPSEEPEPPPPSAGEEEEGKELARNLGIA